MEIELALSSDIDPEVAAAMRRQIASGVPRWNDLRPQCEGFVKKATTRPPDPKTRNQHFISQFWLRLFSEVDHVVLLDVNADTSDPAFAPLVPIEKAAAEPYLFTFKQHIGTVGSGHEARIGYLEQRVSGLFKEIAATKFIPENDFHRWIIANYLAFVFLQSPHTMKLSDHNAAERIENLNLELAGLGTDLSVFYDLDGLRQFYTYNALLQNSSLINKTACLFFCRRWQVMSMPPNMPLALPLLPVVHWGQGLQPAPEIWVPINPSLLLCMSWLPLPAAADLLNTHAGSKVLTSLIRHAKRSAGGRLIVHPDNRKWWKRRIKEHQKAN